MYKVSVIMPIFNGEQYLKDSLDSVVNQSMGFENIELILVDDCSTDNSREIIEEYSKNYSNIKPIFLEENSGCPGIPRNVGIKNATSDYIMFIDDDDEYFPEICDKLYNTMISESVDVVVCAILTTENHKNTISLCSSDEVILGDEIIYFPNWGIYNSIFKKSIILDNAIYFMDENYEDAIFTLNYYLHSKKLIYLKDFVGYHYIIRNDSISSISFEHELGDIKALYTLAKLLREGNHDLNRFFLTRIRLYIWRTICLKNKDEIRGILFALYDFERSINFTGNLPLIHKFINFFILRGNLNIATYICLFFSRIKESNLLLNVYMKFFLKKEVISY